jgi:AcrR family transcriptional regulator
MDTSSKIGKQAGAKSAKREHPQTEGRRDRNKREKVARITAAARTLFHAKGYTKTTTQEVAEAADIGAGTLFLYAKSKEDLLILVFKDEMSQLIEEVYGTIRNKAPLLEKAESLFDGFIEYHRRDVVIARALIRELSFSGNPGRRKDVLTIPEAIIEKLVHFVSAARARGEIRADIDPVEAARCLFAIYYQQLQTWLGTYVSHSAFKQNMHVLLKFVIDGMSVGGIRKIEPSRNKRASRTGKR